MLWAEAFGKLVEQPGHVLARLRFRCARETERWQVHRNNSGCFGKQWHQLMLFVPCLPKVMYQQNERTLAAFDGSISRPTCSQQMMFFMRRQLFFCC